MDRNRVYAVLTATLFIMAFQPAAGIAREKLPVAVASFSDQTGKRLSGPATDYVTETFVRLKYFRVLERAQMDQVVREMERQQSDLMDAGTAVNLGRQMGAKLMVVGGVSGAGYNLAKEQCVIYDKDGNKQDAVCLRASATATLNVRMVNVETGEVVFSDVLSGAASERYQPKSQPAPESALVDQALRGAVRNLYSPVQKAFPLKGTVLKKEGQIIWVDLGSDWGIQKGRGLIIYRDQGQEIRHPQTGEIVGYERTELARDQASEVTPEMCKMKVSKKEAQKIEVGDTVEAKPEIWY